MAFRLGRQRWVRPRGSSTKQKKNRSIESLALNKYEPLDQYCTFKMEEKSRREMTYDSEVTESKTLSIRTTRVLNGGASNVFT